MTAHAKSVANQMHNIVLPSIRFGVSSQTTYEQKEWQTYSNNTSKNTTSFRWLGQNHAAWAGLLAMEFPKNFTTQPCRQRGLWRMWDWCPRRRLAQALGGWAHNNDNKGERRTCCLAPSPRQLLIILTNEIRPRSCPRVCHQTVNAWRGSAINTKIFGGIPE